MIRELSFSNFKAWSSFGPVPLAPITLFFGTNSAGKTSVAQLLLLLKQSAASKDPNLALHFGDDRSDVDLGTFDECLHGGVRSGHEKDAPALALALTWDRQSQEDITRSEGSAVLDYDAVRFETEMVRGPQGQAEVRSMGYALLKAKESIDLLAMRLKNEKKKEFELISEPFAAKRRRGRAWPLPKPVSFFRFPKELDTYFVDTEHSKQLEYELNTLLERVHHLGPSREHPKRQYLWSGQAPESVGATGAQVVEALLGARDRKFMLPGKKQSVGMEAMVAQQLKRMGLIEAFRVAPIAEGRKEHEVLVKTRSGLPEVKLTDVGFGISQALPVVVNAFSLKPNSVMLLEQPEIHLHPKAQAELADLFIDAIQAKEQAKPRSLQILIESHSEHLLRRLQRRLAEGKLAPQELVIYFVHHDGAEAKLERLQVDEGGHILNWPDAFFGDPMEDLVAQAEANAKRAQGAK